MVGSVFFFFFCGVVFNFWWVYRGIVGYGGGEGVVDCLLFRSVFVGLGVERLREYGMLGWGTAD